MLQKKDKEKNSKMAKKRRGGKKAKNVGGVKNEDSGS